MMESESEGPDLTKTGTYAHWTRDVLRFSDADRQGHVNNAVFATFLESGRVSILHDPKRKLIPPGSAFVIARLILKYRAEVFWPNDIAIGTAVKKLGRSSLTFVQGLFVGDQCVATAETVLVFIDKATCKSQPLTEAMRGQLMTLAMK
jgi:acyl-CoA thioester hydrolase